MNASAHPAALVAEDEPVLREALCSQLASLWPQLRIVARAADGLEALQLLARHRPRVVFLDVEMPGLGGLEVARQAPSGTHIVFITAYDQHAVAAFERGAVDYILKPCTLERLAESVRRVRERCEAGPGDVERVLHWLSQDPPRREYLRWIRAGLGNEVRLITVEEVCYFQADAKYTRVVTADSEALIRLSLKELAGQLDPACFWPVHRAFIVNAGAIASVRRDLRGRVKLKLRQRPESLPVSEPHERLFRQM